MQAEFDGLRNFDFAQATAHLWVFKKSTSNKKYSAYHVQSDNNLKNMLKALVQSEMTRITEFSPYSYLAQTNENGCLATSQEGTDFSFLKTQVDRPEPECLARNINDLKGATGYLVKFRAGEQTIYAVKRSSSSWKTSYPKKFINMIYSNGELSAAEDNAFAIERNFDFFCNGNAIFIANKLSFESTMQYRIAYVQALTTLQAAPAFSDLFNDMAPLIAYVGNNSTHLRRMATVQEKNLYGNPGFLTNLRAVSARRGWNIKFDEETGKIVACQDTARDILQVLLDHRLMSEVTEHVYDVPDAVQL